MSALQDEKGCLTEQGLATLRAAPLANHLVSCPRCQRRLLASGGGLRERSGRRKVPSMLRSLLLLGAGLLTTLLAFALLASLAR